MKFPTYALVVLFILGMKSLPKAQEALAIQTSLSTDVEILKNKTSLDDCMHVVRVESPYADTYTSMRADTVNFGHEISMKLRGVPEKKAMLSHLNFVVPIYHVKY